MQKASRGANNTSNRSFFFMALQFSSTDLHCTWLKIATPCLIRRNLNIGPDKDSLCTSNCIYYLTRQFKHVSWVLKRIVLLKRFFCVPTTYVLVEK